MAQPAKSVEAVNPLSTGTARAGDVRRGVWVELATICWMLVEASVALVVGFLTHSVSLQGFGIDSIIELVSGGVLLWRLLVEQGGGSGEVVERAERRAAWVTAIALFALALYIVIDSVISLLSRSHAQASWWGIGLAIAAALIMPLLWRGKLHIAGQIGSAALKADAMCSITCSTPSSAGGGPTRLPRSSSSTSLCGRAAKPCTRPVPAKRVVAVMMIVSNVFRRKKHNVEYHLSYPTWRE
jgi:hypothetical protein